MSVSALLVAAMLIGGAIPSDLTAQRGGGHGGGHGAGTAHPSFGSGTGFVPGGRFGNRWGRGSNNRNGLSGWGYWPNGWDYSSSFADSGWPAIYGDDGSQTYPGTVLLMPQAPPEPPPPPPQPAYPVMHEYSWPVDGGDAHATFSIVPKNGLVRHAVAVWVQDNEVRYTDADGRTGRMPAAAVDCGATERLNAQKNLRLSLPGCGLSR